MSNSNTSNHTTVIAQNRITWWLRGEGSPTELDIASTEHVEAMVKTGFREGELYVTGQDGQTEFRGWWQLELDAPKTLTAEEAVKDIVEALLDSDTLLETIYNQVCAGSLEHKGNSMFELTPDSE